MSLEYPPTTITTANTWKKDLYDRYPAHSSVGYDDANGTLLTAKIVVSDSPYGNGEYKAFGNNWFAYSESTTWGTGEWPVNGPFEKSEGDSNTCKSWHTSGVSMSTGSDMSEPVVLGIEMPDHIKLTSYSMKTRPGFAVRSPKKWNLYGRRNCGTWTLIETRSVTSWSSGQTRSWNLSPSEYYSDYRFDFLTAYDSSLQIYTIKLYGTPEQMSTPISFDRLGNLPFTRTSIYNKATSSAITLERGLKDLADIENTTVMSLDLLQDPTMYNGKFYLPGNGTHTCFFPTDFVSNPGVFLGQEEDGLAASPSSITRHELQITSTSTNSFTVTNPNSGAMTCHWVAIKVGTGTIYGVPYKCELWTTGNNWANQSRNFTYSGLGTPASVAQCQTSNNSFQILTRINTVSSTQTQYWMHRPENTSSGGHNISSSTTYSASETIAFFAIKDTDVASKMYIFPGTSTATEGDIICTYSNNGTLSNPISISQNEYDNHGDSSSSFISSITSKHCKYMVKEMPGWDGNHGEDSIHAIHFAGETSLKPLWHLCANHLNAVQGVSANSHVDRWYNLSQRAFKYAVGRTESGSQKPTLKSDSNGYYVDFNYTGAYFDLPCPITWKFANVDGVGTKGLTCFAVAKFNDTGSTTSDNFFDCCNPGTGGGGPSTETKNGSTYYKAIDEGTSNFGGTVYENAVKTTSGYVELTPASRSQKGQIQWSGMNPGDRLYATFDTWTGSGSGADATYFYWGCTTRPTIEDFNSGGYLLAIDEYGTNEIQLEFNNARLHTEVIGNIDDSAWHSWIVEYKSNTIKVWRDTVLQFTKVDSSRTLSTLVGWGARTGWDYNSHRVRNMKAWVSANNGTGYIGNGTSHTDRLLWGRTSTQLKLQATDPSVQYDTTNSPATVTYKVHTIRYNNPDKTSDIWSVGTKYTPTETTQNTIDNRTTTRNVIGANADLSTSNMKLRELIVFNDILTDNQVSDINTSLAEKWGIDNTYPLLDQWYLVFRQTLGYLWTASQSLSLNSGDSSNDNYSILDTITDFQSTNGTYRLKYVNPANGNYNDWRQTNNLTNAVQAGYSAVNVSHSTNGFNGLGPSGDTNKTRFDGTSGGNWWYAVAAKQNHGGAFPGLDAVHNVVEVYAMKEFI